MRILITAKSKQPAFLSYNYQHVLQSAIYSLIQKSSSEYSSFLHDNGFTNNAARRKFKLFTFSKLNVFPLHRRPDGFHNIKKIQFVFSSVMDKSIGHLISGMFLNQEIKLSSSKMINHFIITEVSVLPAFNPTNHEKFVCLSPITVSTIQTNKNGKRKRRQHFLNYMNAKEKKHFIENLKQNLINKYETFYKTKYQNSDRTFDFAFDSKYIKKRNGNITKLIKFKHGIKIKALESPFSINADPELIKIGYECGFGEKNGAGFGCVKQIVN